MLIQIVKGKGEKKDGYNANAYAYAYACFFTATARFGRQ